MKLKLISSTLFLVLFTSCGLLTALPLGPLDDQTEATAVENRIVSEAPKFDGRAVDSLPTRVDFVGDLYNPFSKRMGTQSFQGFQLHAEQITQLEVSDDGTRVITASNDGTIIESRYNPQESKLSSRFLLKYPAPIAAIALSPAGRFLAVGETSRIHIYDLELGQLVRWYTRFSGRVSSLAWDPEGDLLAVGLASGRVFIWYVDGFRGSSFNNTKAVEDYRDGKDPVEKLKFHPRGRILIAAERSGKIYIMRLFRTDRELGLRDELSLADRRDPKAKSKELGWVSGGIRDILFIDNGNKVLAVSPLGRLHAWTLRGTKKLGEIEASKERLQSLTLLSRGLETDKSVPVVATLSSDHLVRLWCLHTWFAIGPLSPVDQRFIGLSEVDEATGEKSFFDKRLIASSFIFSNALHMIRSAKTSNLLWIAQETGRLLVFDQESFFDQLATIVNSSRCREDTL